MADDQSLPIGEWLRKQPGRCDRCGFHPPTQGHREDCPHRQ